jgi:hypothetical protein
MASGVAYMDEHEHFKDMNLPTADVPALFAAFMHGVIGIYC